MKAPSSCKRITKPWIEYMLSQYEKSKKSNAEVTVKTFEISKATHPGESFNAELVRLFVSATVNVANNGEEKEYNLIVKFLSEDAFNREMIRIMGYHEKEFIMYSEVICALDEFQCQKITGMDFICIPEFIYGKCNGSQYVLVMENVHVLGYKTNDKEKGLNFEHLKLALKHIAQFHAVSYCYNECNDFLTKYPCFKFSPAISALFKPIVYSSVRNTIKFLKTKSNYIDMTAKLEAGMSTLPRKFEAMWDDQSRHSLLTLTHGDYWNSNLMYKESTQGNKPFIEGLKVIDWQISQWNSPVMDLHYLLNTSTTAAMRKAHLDELLKYYHVVFTQVVTAFECKIPNWDYDHFKMEFDRTSLVGFLMGLCLIQGTLSKAGERINQSRSQTLGQPGCMPFKVIVEKCKQVAAKVIVPIAFRSTSQFIIKKSVDKLLAPICEELLSEENHVMNERLLELLEEADEKGILDVMSM